MKRALLFVLIAAGCKRAPDTVAMHPLPPPVVGPEDTAPKEAPRLVPQEAYIRTYLQLFGGLAPLQARAALTGKDNAGLFDSWDDYLGALGLPDYRVDIPRGTQTNALMVAAFERLGVALCDRALEHDRPLPTGQRLIYAFDLPSGAIDEATFAPAFDVLHRTFLGYPARLAPTDRTHRFFKLYSDVVGRHTDASPTDAGPPPFSPIESGWANVCYGLIRHPEFHLY